MALSLIDAAMPLAFFAPFPQNLRAPDASGQLSFIVFAISFAIVLGEVVYRVLGRMFYQQRALDRMGAELVAAVRAAARGERLAPAASTLTATSAPPIAAPRHQALTAREHQVFLW